MGPIVPLSLLVSLVSLPFWLSLCPSSMAYRGNVVSVLGGDVARRRLVSGGNAVCDGLKEVEISKLALLRAFTIPRNGGGGKWVGLSTSTELRTTTTTTTSREVSSSFGFASSWGVLTTLAILFNSIRRLIPVALQPFKGYPPLTSFHWGMYLLSCITLAYAEGYKGFHKKFSPLVVKRALTLDEGGSGPIRLLLAGPFSMGLFHATKKRRITSWSISLGVMVLSQIVKRLPYPWRSIIDVGVVIGLSIGCLSILGYWFRSWTGTPPPSVIDPEFPPRTTINAPGPYQ